MIEQLLSSVRKALEFRNLLTENFGRTPRIVISAANLITMYVREDKEGQLHTDVIKTLGITLKKRRTSQNFLSYVYETPDFTFNMNTHGCFGGEEATIVHRPRSIAFCPGPKKEAEG